MSLKHAILVQLETEPASGYDLLQHFKKGLGYFWNAKHQQIYLQLKKLSEQNLIECQPEQQQGKPDKKIYRITQAGIEELKSWLSNAVKPNKINDALLVKIYGGHLVDSSNLTKELLRHKKMHEKVHMDLLKIEQTYLQSSRSFQEANKLPFLTLRRGILGEDAWLTWVEEALLAIKEPTEAIKK